MCSALGTQPDKPACLRSGEARGAETEWLFKGSCEGLGMKISSRTLAWDTGDPQLEIKRRRVVANCVKRHKRGKSGEGEWSLKRWCLVEA